MLLYVCTELEGILAYNCMLVNKWYCDRLFQLILLQAVLIPSTEELPEETLGS